MVYLRPRRLRLLRRQKTLPIKKVKIIPKRRFTLPKIGQPFINRGKIWKFCARIADNNPIKVIHAEFGMNSAAETNNGIYLRCKSFRSQNTYNCPRKGIFHKANGCLYTIGKHEHQDGGDHQPAAAAGNVPNKLKAGKNVVKGRKARNNGRKVGRKVGTKRRKLEGNVRKRPPAKNNGRKVGAVKRRKLDNNNLAKVVVNVQIYEPPQNNAIQIQQQQNNIVEEIVANNTGEQQNVGGGIQIQQQEQNDINLAELEPDVEIVADINLGKWLPHIKKEPQIREFPILTIQDDNNLAPNAKLARIKNEVADPEEEEPPRRPIAPMPIVEVNRPPQIVAQNQMPAAAPAPVHKMLLRERKIAINYGK